MRILRNSLFVFFSFFFFNMAIAVELFQFDRNVTGFINYSAQDSFLFLSQDGRADWLNVNDTVQVTKNVTYRVTNQNCMPDSQNTSTMDGSQAGMILAYPFLVGVDRVCVIDDTTDSINFVSDFSLPENPYSVVFIGKNKDHFYFLMNSKPWKGDGYLHLISINKNTLEVSIKVFADHVPGYSGAMMFDNQNLWVTMWPSRTYKVSNQTLFDAIQNNSVVNFTQIAQIDFTGMNGMSFFMLANNRAFLYYNDEYDSYTINFENKKMSPISLPCLPVAGYREDWLILCNGQSLQTWNE